MSEQGWKGRAHGGAALALALVLGLSGAHAAPAELPAAPELAAASATDPITVDWRKLRELDYQNGRIPESLKAVDGKLVRIPGYMVPLEDMMERSPEFLLVPYFGACIHTPPPPPNQLVYVVMEGNRGVNINIYDPIWIEGTLKIQSMESVYGSVGFQLTGMKISTYTP